MPTLSTNTGATPSLLTALMPVAANPIAPIGEGGEGGFASVIAGLTPDGLMLDAPPALPDPGTALPPERPELAGSPRPVVLDVEQVMIGSKPPRPVVANMPAPEVPTAPITATPSPTPTSPAPVAPETVEAPAPGPKPVLPQPEAPVTRAHVAPDRPVFRNMPAPVETSGSEDPAPLAAVKPIEPVPVEIQPSELAPVDPAPADPATLPLELVPPVAPPMPVSVQPTPQPVVAEAPEDAVPVPVVVLPMPARTAGVPTSSPAPAKPKASVERPLEPAPIDGRDDPLPVANASAKPVTRPDFVIPPELARQVAQIVRPIAPLTDEPVVDIPAADFAPLTPVAAPQPAPAAPLAFQPAPPVSKVDTARAEWMQAMIDRIGDVVEEGGRREALIRLLPDALGAIEVKIVERDDRLQVTLNADTAQARQLLSEHAPRLAELAEARGLRFAQTDIGGGAQQQDRRPAPEHPATPLRPRSAQAEPDASTDDGDRIA